MKLVRFAILDEDNTIPLDKKGKPIFNPNNDLPAIHQETGYLMAFRRTDKEGAPWKWVKILNIVRGQSFTINGNYDE